MSALSHIQNAVMPVALSLLPEKMNSPAACAMLLATGLQESRFEHRMQVGGPAHGFWQFEQAGGVRGVITHPATRPHLLLVLERLCYDVGPFNCYEAIVHNDVLACVFARLLLWTHPKALPSRGAEEVAWQYYLGLWRPGKPHRETWDNFYTQAWEML